jgi:hypothetical protein
MRVFSAFGTFLFWAAVAAAQTPLGPEFVPVSLEIDASEQDGAFVACDDASVCALVWASFKPNGEVNNSRQWARTISPLGNLSPIQLLRADEGIGAFTPTLPLNPGFALFSQRIFPGRVFVPNLRLYDESLHPQSGFIRQPYHEPARYGDPNSMSPQSEVVAIPGGFAETGFGYDQPEIPCDNGACVGVFLFFFDRQGHKLRERVQVNEDSSAWEEYVLNSLAVDGEGNIIVTFHRIYGATLAEGSKVFVRRFSSAGDPLGPEIEAGAGLPGNQRYPVVAASPDGEFLVAWLAVDPRADFGEIYARRFGAGGEPLGSAFRVSDAIPAQSTPKVAADRHGNYFVVWNSLQEIGYDVRGRLYRHDGRPVAGGFRINEDTADDQLATMAAFAPNGTLTVSYGTLDPAQTGGQAAVPVVRRYAASPGQEVCAVSGSEIRCDLARTGGATELQLASGGRPGGVTLFGDVDGDGRDDVCSYFRRKFRCDVGHEGATAAWSETFGSPGDLPLLADVNGDGRADPCLRRKSSLLCDTLLDGKVHHQVTFGRGGEVPLLGDLDGDHKADLCLVNGSAWDCLLSTGQQRHFQFGHKGDSPALGDADQDGRGDPCVLRPGGRLQCDTKHDGGLPDFTLALNVPSGARLLFGNLDGL